MSRKRYALCGASARGYMAYANTLATDSVIREKAELVGVFDINPGRARYISEHCGGVPSFTDIDEMMRVTKPDCVIIATVDAYHAEYAIRTLAMGVDVFCEKPMAVTAESIRAILEAERKYNRRIGVCFNMRYMRHIMLLKRLVDDGVVGDVYNVHYEWLLTANPKQGMHGATYFHRWNRYMDKCGGLLLTKATHHFDAANWLIGQKPVRVAGFGRLNRYGKAGEFRGKYCTGCEHAHECRFYYPMVEFQQKFYGDNAVYDGYRTDKCAFDEDIDCYDTMALTVEYDGGAIMTYSECSAAMYEGFRISINGSKGRVEAAFYKTGGLAEGETPDYVRIVDLDGKVTLLPFPPAGEGEHGGADEAFMRVLFLGEAPQMPSQRADSVDGALSALIGVAGNRAIATGRVVSIDELIGDASLLRR